MNVVMDDAEEVWLAKPATEKKEARPASRKHLGTWPRSNCEPRMIKSRAGRLLLKGENITLLCTDS